MTEEPTAVGELQVALPVAPTKKPFTLEQLAGPGAPQHFLLESEETVLGRSSDAHICIDSAVISRRHMCLLRTGPQFTCKDLGSSNGIFLNGIKVHSAVLHEGDRIQLGDVVLMFHEGN